MRLSLATVLAALLVLPGSAASQAGHGPDSARVVATALDYIEGWFTGDRERLRSALHPGLVKRRIGPDGRLLDQDAGTLVDMAARMAGGEAPDLTDRVRVLDLTDRSAVVRIDAPRWIDFLLLARTGEDWRIVQVLWETSGPGGRTRGGEVPRVLESRLRGRPVAPAAGAADTLDRATRADVAESVARLLEEQYVKPEVGREMASLLRERAAAGAWPEAAEPGAFARALTGDLGAIARDLHLVVMPPPGSGEAQPPEGSRRVVRVSPGGADAPAGAGAPGGRRVVVRRTGPDEASGAPPAVLDPELRGLPASYRLPPDATAADSALAAARMAPRVEEERRRNHYLREARVLPGNIGYLDLDRFPIMPHAAPAADAAMAFLRNVDAFVLDLRGNPGGGEGLNQYLSSFFFGAEPVHLYSRFYAAEDTTREYWTLPEAPPVKLPDVPLFVLVDGRSGSAAENMAFSLRNTGRATLVGETTAGGAHSSTRVDLPAGFSMVLPVARVFDPRTDRDFEGVGVRPDVEVAPSDALVRAHGLAVEALLAGATDPARRDELEQARALFMAQETPMAPPGELEEYAGEYGNRRFWVREGRLMLVRTDVPGAPELRLLPTGEDAFVLEDLPRVRVEFERDGDGAVTRVRVLGATGDWETAERSGG